MKKGKSKIQVKSNAVKFIYQPSTFGGRVPSQGIKHDLHPTIQSAALGGRVPIRPVDLACCYDPPPSREVYLKRLKARVSWVMVSYDY
ncbi:hypothetical protein U1Q18_017729 [Sarracenia purpurea var. burkii]